MQRPSLLYQHHAKFVFIRRDAHHAPLQKPYEGPFKVVKAREKTFAVERDNRMETISIDRLKPAHVDIDQPMQVALPQPRGPTHMERTGYCGIGFRHC